jgi:hypothetical protein
MLLLKKKNVKKYLFSLKMLAKCELKKLVLSWYEVLLVSARDGLEVEKTNIACARGCVGVTLWSSVCVTNI